MSTDLTVTADLAVTPGAIVVNDAFTSVCHSDVIVFLIDCRSKYFEVDTFYEYDGEKSSYGVLLWPTDETLKRSPDPELRDKPTRIVLFTVEEGSGVSWTVLADGGRYSVTAAAVRNS